MRVKREIKQKNINFYNFLLFYNSINIGQKTLDRVIKCLGAGKKEYGEIK